MTSYLRVGYRCIQGYPSRICSGCTSACSEAVFVEDDSIAITKTGKVLTDADFERLSDEEITARMEVAAEIAALSDEELTAAADCG